MAKPKATTTGEAENKNPNAIKFKQITGDAEGLYALDEEGRVFLYDDDHGWEQIDLDETRTLVEDIEED